MPVRALTPVLAEKARKELNEDPKRLNNDLQSIKEWIAKQPHLIARTDDQWLLAFLRGCKFSLERTKEKLDLFYSIRGTAPELFSIKYNSPLFDEIFNLGSIVLLPKTGGPDAPRVSLVRPGKYDPNKYNVLDVIAVSNIMMKISLVDDDNSTVVGFQSIIDLEGVTMAHFLQMTPLTMKKMVIMGQDAVPFRMKGTHYLNTPPGFETIFNAMKGMLNEKNKNRLFVHNKDIEGMYKYIPKDILPSEYGGNGGTTEEIIEYWKNKINEYDSWLQDDEKYGTDESKRVGKPKTSEDMFGVEGSFRRLEFD